VHDPAPVIRRQPAKSPDGVFDCKARYRACLSVCLPATITDARYRTFANSISDELVTVVALAPDRDKQILWLHIT
jgi:hypothetical protein